MKAFLSFVMTLFLLGGSLLVLYQSHQFSQSLVSVPAQLGFLELACPALSVLGYASPIFSVMTMLRISDVSDFPLSIILAQTGQGLAGAGYGIHIADPAFLFSSVVGLCFQVSWLVCWYVCVRRKSKQYRMHPLGFFMALLAGFSTVISVLVYLFPAPIVGYISCLSALMLCVSPLANLGIVVRSRNSASIPIVMSVIMLLGNIGWATYGILKEDVFVYLPSIFGFVMTCFQLIVTAWCAGLLPYDLAFLQAIFPHQPPTPMSSENTIELGRRKSSAKSSQVENARDE